jgi:hypothetical protein
MRRFNSLVASLVVIVVVTAIAFASCGNEVDPVHGTVPVDTTFWAGVPAEGQQVSDTRFPLDEFRALGEKNDTAGQKALINKYRKELTVNVVRHYPSIKNEKSIRFVLGSGFAKQVKSGDGHTYNGSFRNELIIIIDDVNVKDTVFLACGNGMLEPLEFAFQSDFGSAEQWRFTIQSGEGLANYLPQLEEWANVANELKIPIKDAKGKVVGSEVFTKYLGKYESLLFTGDVIDLIDGKVYNKAGQEVDFNRRMLETRKANAKIAKEKAAKAAKAKAKKKAKAKTKKQRK